jgi:hypothetical protein
MPYSIGSHRKYSEAGHADFLEEAEELIYGDPTGCYRDLQIALKKPIKINWI